jgi:hypothetical protein
MASAELTLPVGQRITLPGHFEGLVTLEAVRALSPDVRDGFECRVRSTDGRLEETILSYEEACTITGAAPSSAPSAASVDAERLRLLIESARIHLADVHDRQFAELKDGRGRTGRGSGPLTGRRQGAPRRGRHGGRARASVVGITARGVKP